MPSPFPGMDPYLEDQGYWKELHTKFLNGIQDALSERVPDSYEVRLEERLSAEEVIEHRIEIRRFPNRELVTVVELLSPSNKEPPGERLYLEMHFELIH